ncbi:MAG TPA: sugar phosphate isomerase/epimerase [Tepidisphaeraceae bacterium]|jgi:sugar phosphate isomerase/epimerase
MLKLAAFADEISPELDEQIRGCRENGITHFELRSVSGRNVLDFDTALRSEIKTKLAANGLAVACIGSPIGKVKINDSWEDHFERFKIAVDAADFFGAHLIRIFSYYPPADGGDIRKYRDEVLRRMRAKVDYIKGREITLVHENERHIYGEKGKECLDLMQSINSSQLRCAFDFANFVQVGENPLDNWPLLKPFTAHIHVKDATFKEAKAVPAGQGDGHLGEILKDAYASGYRGFLSLEPHLAAQGQFSGFSGPKLFKTAADALRQVCRENGIPLAS